MLYSQYALFTMGLIFWYLFSILIGKMFVNSAFSSFLFFFLDIFKEKKQMGGRHNFISARNADRGTILKVNVKLFISDKWLV